MHLTNLLLHYFRITAPLVDLILQQFSIYSNDVLELQLGANQQAFTNRRQFLSGLYNQLLPILSPKLQRSLLLSSEKGLSSWFTTIPLSDHGYTLHKGAFRDALCLRYGWQPTSLPSSCVCGKSMTVEHTFHDQLLLWWLPSIRHNELRDITASLLSEVCHNVRIEPSLQPLSGEHFHYRSANIEDGARLDISAESFGGQDKKMAFFDVKVFNPLAASYSSSPLAQCYCRARRECMMSEYVR